MFISFFVQFENLVESDEVGTSIIMWNLLIQPLKMVPRSVSYSHFMLCCRLKWQDFFTLSFACSRNEYLTFWEKWRPKRRELVGGSMGGNPFRKRALWTLGRQKGKKKKEGKKSRGWWRLEGAFAPGITLISDSANAFYLRT